MVILYHAFINWYSQDTTRHSTTNQGEIKLIPFEFVINLPNTERFGNKLKDELVAT